MREVLGVYGGILRAKTHIKKFWGGEMGSRVCIQPPAVSVWDTRWDTQWDSETLTDKGQTYKAWDTQWDTRWDSKKGAI